MKKTATLVLALCAALLASLLPAVPAAAASYPIDRGVIVLTSTAGQPGPTVLQETNEVYNSHGEARIVVGSPSGWNLDQQRWRLSQTGADTYRFINVASGRALQSTNEASTASPDSFNLVTTPAAWNSAQQEFRVSVDGGTVHIWGKTPAGKREVALSASSYLGMGGVYWATVGSGSWTVSGYTFPAGASAPASTPGLSTIDDADLADWTYVGPWQHVTNQPGAAKNHKGTESSSNTAGARATTTFYGTGFELVGARGPNGGAFRVTVDCATVYEGDSYAATKAFGESLATVEGLLSGLHTVVVEVVGSHQPQSSDSVVVIDAIRSTNTGSTDDGAVKWRGAPSGTHVTGPISLRRTACGTSEDIVQQLKNRTIDGRFLVPGHSADAPVWGAVNAHAASDDVGVIPGPVTVGNVVKDAAAIALGAATSMSMRVALPDRPRTLALAVSADEVLGTPVEFSVSTPDGIILPTLLVRGNADDAGAIDRDPACCAFVLDAGRTTTVIVDLRDVTGAGATPEVVLTARSSTGANAELLVLASRVTDVAYNRYARQLNGGSQIPDPQRFAAPTSAFSRGPVSLSRVLADADQPAWTGNQWTRSQDAAEAVPVTFGETAAGKPLSVGGEPIAADSISITLPPASGLDSRSSVFLRMDLGYRCRSLTASVGLDDSTPSPRTSSVQFEVFGNDQALPTFHNGLWQQGANGEMDDAPNKYPAARHDLTEQLHDFRLAAGNAALTGQSLAAYTALANAEYRSHRSSLEDASPTWTRYELREPLRLGQGANWRSGSTQYYNEGGDEGSMAMSGLFPVAVDLMTASSRDAMRTYASNAERTVESIPTPLVREIEIVISGTPGAVIDLVGAGLDCVSAQPATDGTRAPDAMPTYSQIGVAPMFLPSPRNANGDALQALAKSPMWWDMACPAGPSTAGLQYSAVRTRTTQYKGIVPGKVISFETIGTSTAQSTATKPACGLPADQKVENFTPYGPEQGSVPASFAHTSVTFDDPVEHRLWSLRASGPAKLWDWTKTTLLEASHDTPGLVLWAMLLPFDLPVGLALNPFTMHALPMSAQLALGAAMLSPTMIEKGVVYALPAASRIGASTARAGASELLLLTTEQAAARTDSVVLKLGETDVLVPLRPGTRDADVAIDNVSTARVNDDLAGMPVTDDVAPYVVDPLQVEVERVCKRSTEGGCGSRATHTGSLEEVEEIVELDVGDDGDTSDEDGHADRTNLPPHHSLGYWADYPERLANLHVVEVTRDGGEFPSVSVQWNRTRSWWRQSVADPGFQGSIAGLPDALNVTVGTVSSDVLALDATTDTLYLQTRNFRPEYLVEGLRGVQEIHPASYNLADLVRIPSVPSGLFVLSRRPDMVVSELLAGRPLTSFSRTGGLWIVVVDRPAGGGGIALAETLAASPSPTIRALAVAPEVTEAAPVVVPGGIPSNLMTEAHFRQLNYNTNTLDVVYSLYPEGRPRTAPSAEVQSSRPIPQEKIGDYLIFDKNPDSFGRPTLTIGRPSDDLMRWAAVQDGRRLVFMKNTNAWVPIEAAMGVDEARLAEGKFQVGNWNGAFPADVWIPTNEKANVTVADGWIPKPPPAEPER